MAKKEPQAFGIEDFRLVDRLLSLHESEDGLTMAGSAGIAELVQVKPARVLAELASEFPWVPALSAARKAVLLDLACKLGLVKLKRKYHKFLTNMRMGYWNAAAWELERGRLAPRRASRLRMMLITDEWPQDILD